MYEKREQQADDRKDLRGLSNQQLIQSCLEGNGKENRPAWNEFFRRFIPDIKQGIKDKLRNCGRHDLCHNQEVIGDIHEKIVVKLYGRGALSQCTNLSGVRAWLKTIAQNQTVDWLVKRGRKKRLPQRQSEKSMASFSTPLRGDLDITIGDTIADDPNASDDLTSYVEEALRRISEIKEEKKLWALRLSIVSHVPFSEEETKELAKFNGYPLSEITQRIDEIMEQLGKKEKKRIEAAGKAVLLWHEIRRMETMLLEKNKGLTQTSSEDSEEIRKLEQDIQDKTNRREECLKDAQILCRPSNRDIAELIGIPEEKANQISNILIRARRELKKLNA